MSTITSQYKIKIVKEVYIDLASDLEAEQISEILASRESITSSLGSTSFVYSDFEKVSV